LLAGRSRSTLSLICRASWRAWVAQFNAEPEQPTHIVAAVLHGPAYLISVAPDGEVEYGGQLGRKMMSA
jgi:hypothetical protein